MRTIAAVRMGQPNKWRSASILGLMLIGLIVTAWAFTRNANASAPPYAVGKMAAPAAAALFATKPGPTVLPEATPDNGKQDGLPGNPTQRSLVPGLDGLFAQAGFAGSKGVVSGDAPRPAASPTCPRIGPQLPRLTLSSRPVFSPV